MAVFDWPDTRTFVPQRTEWRIVDTLQRASESQLSGYVQTLAMPGAKWGWAFDFAAHAPAERRDLEAYLLRLNGREHRVRLYDIKHQRPEGTINLSGVTVRDVAAQFATTLVLAGCTAGSTLLAGDWFGVASGQLLRCVADATADGAGVMTVEFRHMLRAALSAGGTVTLYRPTALYVRTDAGLAVPRIGGQAMPGFSVEFTEVFA